VAATAPEVARAVETMAVAAMAVEVRAAVEMAAAAMAAAVARAVDTRAVDTRAVEGKRGWWKVGSEGGGGAGRGGTDADEEGDETLTRLGVSRELTRHRAARAGPRASAPCLSSFNGGVEASLKA
jgi:uncharacterized low-complexity protein